MLKISLENGQLRIDAGPMATGRLRTVPGMRSHPKAKPEPYWTCPARIYQARMLRSLFGGDIVMSEAVRELMAVERELWAHRKTPQDVGDPLLFQYQREAATRAVMPGGLLLCHSVGLGKSAIALSALERTQAFPVLVVTTKSTKSAWVREASRWCPSAVPHLVHGTAAQRTKQFAEAVKDPKALVIVQWDLLRRHSRLAGYGGTTLGPGEGEDKELQQFGFRTVVADEAHRSKDGRSKQTRALWALGDEADYRWGLTGTPIGNEHSDLWALLRFIEPEMFPSRTKFLDRYIEMEHGVWAIEPVGLKENTKPELMDVLDAYMIRRTPADVPELATEVPQIREVRLDIELTPKQKTAYKAMRKDLAAEIGDKLLVSSDPLSLYSRLRYIAQALPEVDDEGAVSELCAPSNKLDALDELLADGLPLPTVWFAESSKLIDLALVHLRSEGRTAEKITGAVSEQERTRIVQDFQDGKVEVLLGTAAMAEGVTLSRGASQGFLQLPSSLIQYVQMSGRVPRIGNANRIIPSYVLVSEGTIDEAIYDLIVAKSVTLEEITKDKERLMGKTK